MDKIRPECKHLTEEFPRMSAAKTKEIYKLYRSDQVDRILSDNEKTALSDFQLVATTYLRNNKTDT